MRAHTWGRRLECIEISSSLPLHWKVNKGHGPGQNRDACSQHHLPVARTWSPSISAKETTKMQKTTTTALTHFSLARSAITPQSKNNLTMGSHFLLVAGLPMPGNIKAWKRCLNLAENHFYQSQSLPIFALSPRLNWTNQQDKAQPRSKYIGPFHGPFCCTRSIKKKEKRAENGRRLWIMECHGVSWNSKSSTNRVFHSWAWNRMMSSDSMLKPRSYSTKPGLSVAWCRTSTIAGLDRFITPSNGNLWCSESQA